MAEVRGSDRSAIVVARFTAVWARDWEVQSIGVGDLRGGEGVTDWCGLGTLWGDWVAATFAKEGYRVEGI